MGAHFWSGVCCLLDSYLHLAHSIVRPAGLGRQFRRVRTAMAHHVAGKDPPSLRGYPGGQSPSQALNGGSVSRYGALLFWLVHVIKRDFCLLPVQRHNFDSQHCLQHLSRSSNITGFLTAGGINERPG